MQSSMRPLRRDFAGAQIPQPVTVYFDAQIDGSEVWLNLRAKAMVHGECARCLDPVVQEETVEAEWTVKEQDLDDPDFELPLDENGKLDVDEWLGQEFLFQIPTVLLCSAGCPGCARGAAAKWRNVNASRQSRTPRPQTQGSRSSNHC